MRRYCFLLQTKKTMQTLNILVALGLSKFLLSTWSEKEVIQPKKKMLTKHTRSV